MHNKFNKAQRIILQTQYFHFRSINHETGEIKTWGDDKLGKHSYQFHWKSKKNGEVIEGDKDISLADLARVTGASTSWVSKVYSAITSDVSIDMSNLLLFMKTLLQKFKNEIFLTWSIKKLISFKFKKQKQFEKQYKTNKYNPSTIYDDPPNIEDSSDKKENNTYKFVFEEGQWWKKNTNINSILYGWKEFALESEIPEELKKLNNQ